MSVHASTWVWDHSITTGNAFVVLLAIAEAANAEGEESCQSVARLARMARCSESTVHRALRALQESGEIEKTGISERYYGTNVWRIPGVSRGVSKGGVKLTGGVIQTPEGVSLVTPEPTTKPTTTSLDMPSDVQLIAVEPEQHPSRPINTTWSPSPTFRAYLRGAYPHVEVDSLAHRFRLHYFANQSTSKSWEARLETWCVNDEEAQIRLMREGTDAMGIPNSQRKVSIVQPAQPGDPDYVDPATI